MKQIQILFMVSWSVFAPEFLLPGGGLSSCRAQQANCSTNTSGDDKERSDDKKGDQGANDPVSMAKGSLDFNRTDFSLPGPAPITVTRYYDSTMGFKGPYGNNVDASFRAY